MDKDTLIYEYINDNVLNKEGVNSFAAGIADSISNIISRTKEPAGIKLEHTESGINIDIKIIVDFGVNIPQLSYDIQHELKKGIEAITDEHIDSINISIEGVRDNEQR